MYPVLCEAARILCALLSIPVMVLALPGFLTFARSQGVRNGLASIAFLAGVSSGSYQIRYLLDDVQGAPPSAQLLLSQVLSAALLAVALLMLLRLQRYPRGSMARIENNIDAALAIVDLAQLRPDQAEQLVGEARRLTALAMLERARGT